MDKRRERIERFKSNAKFQRKQADLQGCLEFRELAEELEKLEKIEQIVNSDVDPNICNNVGDVRKIQAIKKILEQEETWEKQND